MAVSNNYTETVNLGGVTFNVPITNIKTSVQSNITSSNSIRESGSAKLQTDQIVELLEITFYAFDQNGLKTAASLMQLYKNIPFVWVASPYINAGLNICDVALHSVTISSVPGFPNTYKIDLVLAPFDSFAITNWPTLLSGTNLELYYTYQTYVANKTAKRLGSTKQYGVMLPTDPPGQPNPFDIFVPSDDFLEETKMAMDMIDNALKNAITFSNKNEDGLYAVITRDIGTDNTPEEMSKKLADQLKGYLLNAVAKDADGNEISLFTKNKNGDIVPAPWDKWQQCRIFDVYDPDTGKILTGASAESKFLNLFEAIEEAIGQNSLEEYIRRIDANQSLATFLNSFASIAKNTDLYTHAATALQINAVDINLIRQVITGENLQLKVKLPNYSYGQEGAAINRGYWDYLLMGVNIDVNIGGNFKAQAPTTTNQTVPDHLDLFVEDIDSLKRPGFLGLLYDIYLGARGFQNILSGATESLAKLFDRDRYRESGYIPAGLTQFSPQQVVVSFNNKFSTGYLQNALTVRPIYSYVGSGDFTIQILNTVTDPDHSELKKFTDTIDLAFLQNKKFQGELPAGFIAIRDPLVQSMGIFECLIIGYSVTPMPEYPNVFHVELTTTDFNLQKRTEYMINRIDPYGKIHGGDDKSTAAATALSSSLLDPVFDPASQFSSQEPRTLETAFGEQQIQYDPEYKPPTTSNSASGSEAYYDYENIDGGDILCVKELYQDWFRAKYSLRQYNCYPDIILPTLHEAQIIFGDFDKPISIATGATNIDNPSTAENKTEVHVLKDFKAYYEWRQAGLINGERTDPFMDYGGDINVTKLDWTETGEYVVPYFFFYPSRIEVISDANANVNQYDTPLIGGDDQLNRGDNQLNLSSFNIDGDINGTTEQPDGSSAITEKEKIYESPFGAAARVFGLAPVAPPPTAPAGSITDVTEDIAENSESGTPATTKEKSTMQEKMVGKKRIKKIKEIQKHQAEHPTTDDEVGTEDTAFTMPLGEFPLEFYWIEEERYNKRGDIAQLFPTFHIMIIDEFPWQFGWKMKDFLYQSVRVERIKTYGASDDLKEFAFVDVANTYGDLTKEEMNPSLLVSYAFALKKPPSLEERLFDDYRNFFSNLANMLDRTDDIETYFAVKSAISNVSGALFLKQGVRVQIRMGYESNPLRLKLEFMGKIQTLGTGESFQIVCVSDGVEFDTPINNRIDTKGTMWNNITTFFDKPADVYGVINNFMNERGGAGIFGNLGDSVKTWLGKAGDWGFDRLVYESPYGIEHFGYRNKAVPGRFTRTDWDFKSTKEVLKKLSSDSTENSDLKDIFSNLMAYKDEGQIQKNIEAYEEALEAAAKAIEEKAKELKAGKACLFSPTECLKMPKSLQIPTDPDNGTMTLNWNILQSNTKIKANILKGNFIDHWSDLRLRSQGLEEPLSTIIKMMNDIAGIDEFISIFDPFTPFFPRYQLFGGDKYYQLFGTISGLQKDLKDKDFNPEEGLETAKALDELVYFILNELRKLYGTYSNYFRPTNIAEFDIDIDNILGDASILLKELEITRGSVTAIGNKSDSSLDLLFRSMRLNTGLAQSHGRASTQASLTKNDIITKILVNKVGLNKETITLYSRGNKTLLSLPNEEAMILGEWLLTIINAGRSEEEQQTIDPLIRALDVAQDTPLDVFGIDIGHILFAGETMMNIHQPAHAFSKAGSEINQFGGTGAGDFGSGTTYDEEGLSTKNDHRDVGNTQLITSDGDKFKFSSKFIRWIKLTENGGLHESVIKGGTIKPYDDGPQWSIGYGNFAGEKQRDIIDLTLHPPIYKSIPESLADQLLVDELNKFRKQVLRILGDSANLLNQSQIEALTSMTYNTGAGNTKTKRVYAAIKEGNLSDVPRLIREGENRIRGKGVDPGLTRRRKDESIIWSWQDATISSKNIINPLSNPFTEPSPSSQWDPETVFNPFPYEKDLPTPNTRIPVKSFLDEIKPAFEDSVNAALGRPPGKEIRITSTTGGTHAENSMHYRRYCNGKYKGLAFDVGAARERWTDAQVAIMRDIGEQYGLWMLDERHKASKNWTGSHLHFQADKDLYKALDNGTATIPSTITTPSGTITTPSSTIPASSPSGIGITGGVSAPISGEDLPPNEALDISTKDMSFGDLFSIYQMACADFIVKAIPFENRSTIFFGRPRFGVVDGYVDMANTIIPDPAKNLATWQFDISKPLVKPFMQNHVINSKNIIANGVVATDKYIANVAIPTYHTGNPVGVNVFVDHFIPASERKASEVNTRIMAAGQSQIAKFLGIAEDYSRGDAIAIARGYLKNKMREMYQGYIITMGMPGIKPFDMVHLYDHITEMNGAFEAGVVINELSQETGYITSIKPNLISTIMDAKFIYIYQKLCEMAGIYQSIQSANDLMNSETAVIWKQLGHSDPSATQEALMPPSVGKSDNVVTIPGVRVAATAGVLWWASATVVHCIIHGNPISLVSGLKRVARAFEGAEKFGWLASPAKKSAHTLIKLTRATKSLPLMQRFLKPAGISVKLGTKANVITLVATVVISAIVGSMVRSLINSVSNLQSLCMMPMKIGCAEFSAGINGHLGSVIGDPSDPIISALDKFMGSTSGQIASIAASLFTAVPGDLGNITYKMPFKFVSPCQVDQLISAPKTEAKKEEKEETTE